jgi:protein-disulfide isomerase
MTLPQNAPNVPPKLPGRLAARGKIFAYKGMNMTEAISVPTTLKNAAIALVLGLGLALAGCGDSGEETGGPATAAGDLGDRDWGNFGQEGDIVLGDMDAPVSIIEYASTTCSHCAQFSVFTFPFLKEEYIDTGLVRYTMRPLPTPPTNMALTGFMIAACVPESRYYNFIDALMRTQGDWAFNRDANARTEALARLAAQAGMSRSEFDACRLDEEGLSRLNTQVQASQAAGIRSTPTFDINGERVEGFLPWEQFEPYIIAHLPEELRPAPEGDSEASDSADESSAGE